MSRTVRRHPVRRVSIPAAVMILIVGIVLPASLSAATDKTEPVLHELDQLLNGDRPISLELERVTAAKALEAIAAAGRLRIVMEGSADCCVVNLYTIDVPLRRALELLAAQTDARYQLVAPESLRVWLPELFMPGAENEVTMPVILNRAEPVYPQDAREARAEGRVVVQAVIRYDGTIGNVTVLTRAEGWPSLDEAAVAAVRKRTYRPAMKNGEPVSVYFTIRVDFALR